MRIAAKQEPPLNSVSDDYSAAIEKKAAQSVEVPSGTGFDPAPQSGTSSGTLAEEEIEGNVELLREAIAAGDFEVVKVLTSAWSIAFKQAVWSQLTQSEKEAAKALALQPKGLKVGDRVTMSDPYHARASQQGTIEAINSLTGAFVVRWDCDGDSQIHVGHRSYAGEELSNL